MKNGILSMELRLEITGAKLPSINCRCCSGAECMELPSRRTLRRLNESDQRHGFILDLVECFIQRDLGYQTKDIRLTYMTIKNALLDPNTKTVIVIGHSQGGIIVSMALDNLLSDLPRECPIAKHHPS